jgi:hypothetical protein
MKIFKLTMSAPDFFAAPRAPAWGATFWRPAPPAPRRPYQPWLSLPRSRRSASQSRQLRPGTSARRWWAGRSSTGGRRTGGSARHCPCGAFSHVVAYSRQTSALRGTADSLLDAASNGVRWVLLSPAAAAAAGVSRDPPAGPGRRPLAAVRVFTPPAMTFGLVSGP